MADVVDRDLFVTELMKFHSDGRLIVYGYVVMPTHIHLVVVPQEGVPTGRILGELKMLSARIVIAGWKARLGILPHDVFGSDGKAHVWQARGYDHNCRSEESVIQKINYCHNNSVRAGLVVHPSEWRWSSYHWYSA